MFPFCKNFFFKSVLNGRVTYYTYSQHALGGQEVRICLHTHVCAAHEVSAPLRRYRPMFDIGSPQVLPASTTLSNARYRVLLS